MDERFGAIQAGGAALLMAGAVLAVTEGRLPRRVRRVRRADRTGPAASVTLERSEATERQIFGNV